MMLGLLCVAALLCQSGVSATTHREAHAFVTGHTYMRAGAPYLLPNASDWSNPTNKQPTLSACQKQCTEMIDCTYGTYITSGNRNQECWLSTEQQTAQTQKTKCGVPCTSFTVWAMLQTSNPSWEDALDSAAKHDQMKKLGDFILTTNAPTSYPTPNPTTNPTLNPTTYPTPIPSAYPTSHPTPIPTDTPTPQPTSTPTANPTQHPCNGDQHGCDKTAGGRCHAQNGNSYTCSCAGPGEIDGHELGFWCQEGCDTHTSWQSCELSCEERYANDESEGIAGRCAHICQQRVENPHVCVAVTPSPTPYPTPSPTTYPTPSPTAYPTSSPTPAPTASCPVKCALQKHVLPSHPLSPDNQKVHKKVIVTHNVFQINTQDTYTHHKCYRTSADSTDCVCECIDAYSNIGGVGFFEDGGS